MKKAVSIILCIAAIVLSAVCLSGCGKNSDAELASNLMKAASGLSSLSKQRQEEQKEFSSMWEEYEENQEKLKRYK